MLCVCEMCRIALMYKRELKMFQWLEVGPIRAAWGGLGGNKVTGRASARLLRLFVHRLLRHHGFEALLLGCWGEKSEV